MHYVGVYNRDGGTFKTTDMDAFCREAERVFAAHGHSLSCRLVCGPELTEQLSRAVAERPDALLAGGGDGTISAAAGACFEHGLPLAILPAGTMNLFARELHMPLDLGEALEALATGTVTEIDIATANGRPFLLHFSVGIHSRLVRTRDKLQYHSRLGKLMATTRSLLSAFIRPPRFEVEIRTPQRAERRQASGVEVSNNPIGEGHLPYADRLDRGVLGVYIAEPMSGMAIAKLGLGLLVGRWKDFGEVTEKQMREVTLSFPRVKASAQAVIDGELIPLEKKLEFKIHPKALKVMMPPRDKAVA
jgi:diacylglycerol kinase family enzyme